jgi:hypothetical protein
LHNQDIRKWEQCCILTPFLSFPFVSFSYSFSFPD